MTVNSKLVLECLECLSELATHNSVQLVWVPGHEGVFGNVRAEELAKKGADTLFTGPEPVLGQPYSVVKRAIGDWMEETQSAGSLAGTASTLRPSWKGLNKAGLLNC